MSHDVSVITGGSSGFGLEIARVLSRQNHDLFLVSRSENDLENVKHEIEEKYDNNVYYLDTNIRSEEDVQHLYKQVDHKDLSISRLFNVAGSGLFGAPDKNSRQMIDSVFEANVIGMILMSTYALRRMKNDGGHIVNVMSTAALKGRAQESIYCAAKWGARGYTEALQAATKGTDVHVTAVYPGGMDTDFWSGDVGMSPDTDSFMSAADVAEKVASILTIDTSVVNEIIIDRNRVRLSS
jgi:short-subunit dehydrogenase